MESCGPPRVSKKRKEKINCGIRSMFLDVNLWLVILLNIRVSFRYFFEIYSGSLLVVKSRECRESHGLSS